MPPLSRLDHRAGRLYFAGQALAGLLWWVGVFLFPPVREATLGTLDPVLVAWWDIPLFVVGSALVAGGIRPATWVVTGWTCLVAAGMVLYATVNGEAGWGALLMTAAALGSGAAALLILLGRVPVEWTMVGPFAFRPAAPASTGRHAVRTGGQLLVFWGLFLLVLPAGILAVEHRWRLHLTFPDAVRWAGLGILVAASALGLWAAAAMSTRGQGTPLPSATARLLVIAGPYRFVRNPMAVAGIVQGVAVGMIASSWLVVVYALCGSLLWNAIVRPQEEADLEARFGAGFTAYARRVRCWIPRLRPVPSSDTR